MGIKHLLLAVASDAAKVSDFSDKVVAVDGHMLIHKSLKSPECAACAEGVLAGERAAHEVWLARFVSLVRCLLRDCERVLVVFDGHELPAKAGTNEGRRLRRADALDNALTLQRSGDGAGAAAAFAKAVEVTPDMVRRAVRAARGAGARAILDRAALPA